MFQQKKVKEIEEGSKREFIETIRDPPEIVELLPQILSSTYEELSILFRTIKTFKRFESEGLFEFLKHQIDKFNIYVKLLVRGDHYNYDENKQYTGFESLKKYKQNIELQFSSNLDTGMLTIVADREPTILSHHSIFETSWVEPQISSKV